VSSRVDAQMTRKTVSSLKLNLRKMAKQITDKSNAPLNLSEFFGINFETEKVIGFTVKDFLFEAKPQLIIGKDSDGNRTAKIRFTFECRSNSKAVCHQTTKDGKVFPVKEFPYSRSIEFPIEIEKFANERAMHDWFQDTVENFRNGLTTFLVEAAKEHFLTIACLVTDNYKLFPFSIDMIDRIKQSSKSFEETEKEICRVEKVRKNAAFKNRAHYIENLNQVAEKLKGQGLDVTQENVMVEMLCNVRTLRVWNKNYGIDWKKFLKKWAKDKTGNDLISK